MLNLKFQFILKIGGTKERRNVFIKLVAVIGLFTVFWMLLSSREEETEATPIEVNYIRTGPQNCSIPQLTNVEQFFNLLQNFEPSVCSNLSSVGGFLYPSGLYDGDKYVCFDPEFKFQFESCTILSFGVNNEWSFELKMDEEFGCKVFAFDPTDGHKNFMKTPRIRFLNLGISNFEGTLNIGSVDRYEGILYKLGLQDTQIDYLKMDVEGYELDFLEDLFDTSYYLVSRIKQIGMEIHVPHVLDVNISPDYSIFWKSFHKMECAGFKMASVEMNRAKYNQYMLNGEKRSVCYEVLWVRI